MDINSLKRLLVTLLGAGVILAGNKLGLSPGQEQMVTALLSLFLAQSGVNAALSKFAVSKGGKVLEKGLETVDAVEGALGQAKAAGAQAAGQAAAQTPGSPSQG